MNYSASVRRAVTIERLAYGFALRKSARLGGIFQADEDRPVVVVLRLPAGSSLAEYAAAAEIMVAETPALISKIAVAAPKVPRKGAPDAEVICAEIKKPRSLMVVWPNGHDLPREIALAADRIVEVEEVRPSHLMAAVKATDGRLLDPAMARRLLAHSHADLFAALRRGRPFDVVLRRLDATKPAPEKAKDGPLIEDMVGFGEAKAWGQSLACDINEWKAGRLGWKDVDRGVLLSGPPGTGKTLYAGVLARTCGASLVATSVSRWQSAGHLDDTLAAMRRSFEDAAKSKPCILFLDEFDAIGDRATFRGGEHEIYWTQCVNLLLELMDGHERLEGVVVVAATNFPDKIDPAFRRAGRLDRHIGISLPDHAERRRLASEYFGDHLSERDFDRIAVATSGLTGADFERAGRDARRAGRRAGREIVIDDVLAHLPTPTVIVGPNRRTISLHEAGHAIVGAALEVGVLKTVAVPWETRGAQPAGFAHFEMDGAQLVNREMLLARIAMILGGRAAEEVILGTAYDGAGAGEGSDLHHASDLATMMVVQFGMGGSLSYRTVKSVADRDRVRADDRAVAARVERILAEQMKRAADIVRARRLAVQTVADILVEKGIVEGEEVHRILKQGAAA